ncbi:MAG TPA: AbrB/MazE/SpoVT family DNA-binding domain-containing protein [Actinomycetota bacterium]|nr:AbrB/MazE/SpoVT family DNA-binding domain-containing protein [Actinomycetota bacterium]
MAASRVRDKGQITLPKKIREAAHVEEGDALVIEVVEGGILLRPQKMIDASQAWFWTSEWQDGERSASKDINESRTEVFKSSEDFLAALDERKHK